MTSRMLRRGGNARHVLLWRAAGLVAGVLADQLLGDPRRAHPVAGFGAAATALEQRWWADTRRRGVAHVAVCVVPVVALGALGEKATARSGLTRAGLVALATWTVLGGRSLAREAGGLAGSLVDGDLAGARDRLPSLCGRDPWVLDADGLARATVESVAENTSDAVVAPLVWGAVAGVPGLLGYRAVNTLDAMVGHRSPRYRRFGWAAARLDDVANLAPARLTAACVAVAAPVVGGRAAEASGVWRRHARRHPSPNAGPVEAAVAGALGVRLGGKNSYGEVVEDRGTLGHGDAPTPHDVTRAVRLCRAAGVLALGVCVAGLVMVGGRR